MLQKKHSSIPYNPDIANAFFVAVILKHGDEALKKSTKIAQKRVCLYP
ncbi:MAG: hypothetical protein LBC20_17490 [Planctomycetaceae bacterium]|jgi:hypothetical protein|nr:hypothetical protein [Planctomycetaceae bacterium]